MPMPASFDLPNLREPGKPHRFSAENQPAGRGRPLGSGDKITRDLKRGIIDEAISHGYDGEGLDGLPGYCRHLARFHPKAFAHLLAKMLPLQVDADVSNAVIGSVRVISVPVDHYLSAADIAKLRPVPEIEHAPQPEPCKSEQFEEDPPEPEPLEPTDGGVLLVQSEALRHSNSHR